MAVAFPLALLLLVAAEPAPSEASAGLAGGPSVLALAEIPPTYLALYVSAASTCPGLPWGVLAGIGKAESDHGQSTALGVHSGANPAGAEGPMQFEPATFAQYATDGDHDGRLSPYDPADAIYTAASMLCANGAASGAPAGIRRAVFAYNHSQAYVTQVLGWAARYTIPAPSGVAAAAIGFAVRQVGKPYRWGATATVDLMTAATALRLGRTKAYDLARRDQFPCRVLRIGETYRVPTAGLLELLGVAAEESRGQTPAGSRT